MTAPRTLDERISGWLDDEAPDQLPDIVLRTSLERTREVPQRRFLRWGGIFVAPRPVAMVAATVAVVLGGSLLFAFARPSSVGPPAVTPSPTIAAPSATLGLGRDPVALTGQVAFEWTVDGNTDIYLMNLDRTGLVRLTDDPAVDAGPAWSPDGTRIVFTRGSGEARDIFVVRADGAAATRLTSSPEGEDLPAFSPDGSEIAFIRYIDRDYFDLFVIDSDGSKERRIWHQEGGWAAGPRWSPDGTAIYLNRDESSGGMIDIVRVDVATGAMRPITTTPGDDSAFAVSPDGGTIAFQSDRPPGGLFLMDGDGSNVRHLTGNWDRGYPLSWSSDGLHLVYAMPDGWLYLIGINGTGLTQWAQAGPGVSWRPAP